LQNKVKIIKFYKQINQELNAPLVFTHTLHHSQMAHIKSVLHPLFLLTFTTPTTHKIKPNQNTWPNLNTHKLAN